MPRNYSNTVFHPMQIERKMERKIEAVREEKKDGEREGESFCTSLHNFFDSSDLHSILQYVHYASNWNN